MAVITPIEDSSTMTNSKSAAPKKDLPEYDWSEITQHDKPNDCWIVIHGFVYDLTEWVPKHPGGDVIYDGAGGDCTSMFESYHPLYVTRKGVPEKYLVGRVKDYKDFYSWDGAFYTTLKERVEKVLPLNKRRDDPRMLFKAFVCFGGWLVSYFLHLSYMSWWSLLLISFFASQIAVNIMHDGNHGAFTSNKTLCWWAGFSLDLIGSSSVVYRRSHDFGHHGCVNHYELDRAFDSTYPFIRLHKFQPLLSIHKWQHYYTWLLYGLANFADFKSSFSELSWMSNFPTRQGFVSFKDKYLHMLTKVSFFVYSLVIPATIHGFWITSWMLLLHFILVAYGYTLFFAVNHWTKEAEQVDNSSISSTNWAILQVTNSSNFAIDSPLWTWLSGGLNYQIEHHLFPGIVHTRYPEIAPIVQQTCKEFGIRYYNFPTFYDALKSHYDMLKELSVLPQPKNSSKMAWKKD